MTFDLSLGQWPFLMRAGIGEGEVGTVDIEQGNLFALDDDQARLTRCDLVRARRLNKLGHARTFQPLRFGLTGKRSPAGLYNIVGDDFTYGWGACRRRAPLP